MPEPQSVQYWWQFIPLGNARSLTPSRTVVIGFKTNSTKMPGASESQNSSFSTCQGQGRHFAADGALWNHLIPKKSSADIISKRSMQLYHVGNLTITVQLLSQCGKSIVVVSTQKIVLPGNLGAALQGVSQLTFNSLGTKVSLTMYNNPQYRYQ